MATTPALPEYTPELDKAALDALLRKIQEQHGVDVASAHGDATARGLTGSSYEATRLGLADKGNASATADAMTNFALQKAQMLREERLNKENQDFQNTQRELQNQYMSLEQEKQNAFNAGETAKAQQFAAQQQELERQNQDAISRREGRQATLGAVGQLAGNLGGAAILHSTGMFGGAHAATAAAGAGAGASGAAGAAGTGILGSGLSAGPLALGAAGYAASVGINSAVGQALGRNVFSSNTARTGARRGAQIGSLISPIGGPVGALIGGSASTIGKAAKKIFCFMADTPVLMINETEKPIEQLEIGDETKGGRVISIRKSEVNDVYDYFGIKVTGHHAVKEGKVWLRVKDSTVSIPLTGITKTVYSIVTEFHKMYVPSQNGIIITFADETESDYYEELTIDESLALLNRLEEAA